MRRRTKLEGKTNKETRRERKKKVQIIIGRNNDRYDYYFRKL